MLLGTMQVYSVASEMPRLIREAGPQMPAPEPLKAMAVNQARIDLTAVLHPQQSQSLPPTENFIQANARIQSGKYVNVRA